jgi:hypothetical protein
MSQAVTIETAAIPSNLRTWISDFCASRTSVSVGHRMFAADENVGNIPLPNALYLIRKYVPVAQFIGDDPERRKLIAKYVAAVIAEQVVATFETANYPGD